MFLSRTLFALSLLTLVATGAQADVWTDALASELVSKKKKAKTTLALYEKVIEAKHANAAEALSLIFIGMRRTASPKRAHGANHALWTASLNTELSVGGSRKTSSRLPRKTSYPVAPPTSSTLPAEPPSSASTAAAARVRRRFGSGLSPPSSPDASDPPSLDARVRR